MWVSHTLFEHAKLVRSGWQNLELKHAQRVKSHDPRNLEINTKIVNIVRHTPTALSSLAAGPAINLLIT